MSEASTMHRSWCTMKEEKSRNDKLRQPGCRNQTIMMVVVVAAPKLSPGGKPCYAEYSAAQLFSGGKRLDTKRYN